MRKVAVVTNIIYNIENTGKDAGGGAVVTARLINSLNQNPDIDLTVFALIDNTSHKPDFKYKIFSENISIKKRLLKIDEIIKNENYDTVITANIFQPYKNNMLQAHSFIEKSRRSNFIFSAIKKFLGRKKIEFERNIYNQINSDSTFIAMSKTIKKDYCSNFNINPNNVKVVYPGCNQVYEQLPLFEKKDIPTFGIVANSSVNKGGHLFLFAMGLLKISGFKFNIKMIAPKYNKDFVMNLTVNLFNLKNNLEILPKQSDMTNFYKSIDYLVLPSYNEAFGLVAIEAGAFGKPSVLSSSAGIAEIVNENNSFVFNIKSFRDYIRTLKSVINLYQNNYDLYLKYCKNVFELSKEYTWENFANNILNNNL